MIIRWIGCLCWLVFLSACGNTEVNNEVADGVDHSGHQLMTGSSDYCDSVNKGLIAEDTLKGSPLRTAMNTISGNHVHLEYSSPGVKERIIWGGLVGWDKVWVAGAHAATTVRFYKPVIVNGQEIKAGTYAFFVMPGRENWTIILNSRYNQHLTDEYQESQDIIRVEVKPAQHPNTERLSYSVEQVGENAGTINLMWEKIKLSLPFKTM